MPGFFSPGQSPVIVLLLYSLCLCISQRHQVGPFGPADQGALSAKRFPMDDTDKDSMSNHPQDQAQVAVFFSP
jgi:hypothetical protein